MIYRFDTFELDVDKAELRADGAVLSIEPQVFALLLLLLENRDRLISKDEIVEKVWGGRIVSDSAIISRVKSARRAIGDDGKTQRLIKTVYRKGFRFVGEAAVAQLASAGIVPAVGATKQTDCPSAGQNSSTRPSIAVLPFSLVGTTEPHRAIAEALPHDLIVEISRLRWLFVIARGSSFRFRDADADLSHVAAVLGVRYCLTGSVEVVDKRLKISVELNDAGERCLVWADRIDAKIDDIYETRARIAANMVAALEIQISMNEARRARFVSPDNLTAWSAYHLGLRHMYRFNKRDNAIAMRLFERAVAEDPEFARAHAGLSFVHFQNAFARHTQDTAAAREAARRCAEQAIASDALDPFANFTMGRAFWLEGDVDSSLDWLDRSIAINPNYAQGIYARGWADTVLGRGEAGDEFVNLAMSLSPLDPLRYGMLGARALAHLARGEVPSGCKWAERAARAPGAHVLIAMIAAIAYELAGERNKARVWARNVRERNPAIVQADFFQSFPFQDRDLRRRWSAVLTALGF